MTIGWGLYGWFYHSHAVAVVAVRPACHTFKLLDEVEEFVLCVPTEEMAEAVAFCGKESGRDFDKFKRTGLTPVPSTHVRPVSIAECLIHVECRIYHKQRAPHFILTPEHREKPLEAQHAIYFAEVLGTFVARC
jgi:flavin reductase (DIM6/NTAB) family NADH-FMN oxidoreductase RutF